MKNTFVFIFVLSLALLFGGCRRGEGPALVNATHEKVSIVVEFSDGRSISTTVSPQEILWRGRLDVAMTMLSITRGNKTVRYEKVDIDKLMTNLRSQNDAALLIGDSQLKVMTIRQLMSMERRYGAAVVSDDLKQ